ncbi:hypothetical protein [Tissierella praeacuta]|uniref:hypothetical protein n=1 Tax=Tissierella praeacuta TaxID=43131 RepID=UPI0028AB9B6A|nr:hypothetical protein [Tissierella praeacuta]
MRTAKEMYEYCLQNKFGQGFNQKWGVKHFSVIEDNLLPDEEVVMTFIGMHTSEGQKNTEGYYAYAITDKRLLMG